MNEADGHQRSTDRIDANNNNGNKGSFEEIGLKSKESANVSTDAFDDDEKSSRGGQDVVRLLAERPAIQRLRNQLRKLGDPRLLLADINGSSRGGGGGGD